MLTPSHRKDVLNEAEEENDVFQDIMNKAYDRWQKGGDLEGKSSEEFVNALDEKAAMVVRLGNMNYQVGNGGWDQWYGNGFGERDGEAILAYLEKNAEFSSFDVVRDILEGVMRKKDEHAEDSGEQSWMDDEEDEWSEPDYDDNPDFSVEDTAYYKIDDQFVKDINSLLSDKTSEIQTVSAPIEEPSKEEPAQEPEKQRPTVKLAGQDGNAFAVLGKVAKALKDTGYSAAEIEDFRTDATSGDYDHLLQTAMKWVDVQ